MNDVQRLRRSVRPLVLDSGIAAAPIGIWGTCFLAAYRSTPFAVTAAHLVKENHSGQVRVLASYGSSQRLPLSQGVGAIAEEWQDEVDLIVYPASLIGMRTREVRRANLVNLDVPGISEWHDTAPVAQFLIIGYPREHTEVDYELGMASAGQVLLTAEYQGAVSGSRTLQQVAVANPLNLQQFAGFSGAPVFSIQYRLAAQPEIRFSGVAVSGSASSGLIHFVDAIHLVEWMTNAIDHVRKFGLQLTKAVGR